MAQAVAQHDFNQRVQYLIARQVKRMTAEKATQTVREDTMDLAANHLGAMQDTDTKQMRTESDPRAAMYINKMFADVVNPT